MAYTWMWKIGVPPKSPWAWQCAICIFFSASQISTIHTIRTHACFRNYAGCCLLAIWFEIFFKSGKNIHHVSLVGIFKVIMYRWQHFLTVQSSLLPFCQLPAFQSFSPQQCFRGIEPGVILINWYPQLSIDKVLSVKLAAKIREMSCIPPHDMQLLLSTLFLMIWIWYRCDAHNEWSMKKPKMSSTCSSCTPVPLESSWRNSRRIEHVLSDWNVLQTSLNINSLSQKWRILQTPVKRPS